MQNFKIISNVLNRLHQQLQSELTLVLSITTRSYDNIENYFGS